MRCSKCGTENPTGKKFCGDCGAAFANLCPKCGADNPAGRRFCGDCGAALSDVSGAHAPAAAVAEPRAAADGERRHLTVLFCDLVGSTPLSQQLDAEEWREVIAQYQQAASRAVALFGGHVAKNLGDGLLIYFGWPTAREDDPERAVRAGLAIVDAMVPLNAALAADDGARLEVRVGIHTGPVVIADGGEVFGETANIAARVQTAAEPDTVVITAATQRLVAGMFMVEDRGPQALKGVREPVTLYRVVRPSGVRSRLDVAAGRLTPFVGREVELATLVERWERAQDGEGQNILIVGEAGVGKSRLVYQLRERLADVPHTWLECGATPYTEGTPFHPVIALVSQGLVFTPEDTAAEKLKKLEGGLRALASTQNVALMAEFLGLSAPTPLTMSLDLKRQKTIELLAAWNLALSEAQPLVLLVEDLHWCDPSSLELLGRLIAQSATARVMVLATARPEFTAPWPSRENVTTLSLARLTKRQARDMVASLSDETLPADTLEALVARAGGVPLYVEELTKAMVEPGAPRGMEAIPATLADSLIARLDRLSAAKEVAQRAAVLGREFSYPLLAAVAGLGEAALRHGLARLAEAEILFARGEPPEAMYTFKHALVQEAAYQSLLKRARQQFHGRVVDVLVAEFPDRAAAEPEVVARHAELAGRIDDAISSYQRAGEHAQARPAHAEAIGHLRQAIALLATQPEGGERDARELALQLLLAWSLMVVRSFAHVEVEAAYARARVLSEGVGDRRRLGQALIGLATFSSFRGDIERSQVLAHRVLAIAEQLGDTEMALLGHYQLGDVEYNQGKFASSLAHFEASLALHETGQVESLSSIVEASGAATRGLVALNLLTLGWPDRALARAREAVVLARELGSPFALVASLLHETMVHRERRDVTAVRERAAEAIALSEIHGFTFLLNVGRTYHAAARLVAGEPEALADLLAALLALVAAGKGQRGVGAPGMLALLGEADMIAGQLTEARVAVETGLAIAAQTGAPIYDAELHRLQGQIVLATRGSPADAEAFFQQAIDIARAQEAKTFELRAATSLAHMWRDQGKRVEARDLLAPLYAWFTEGLDTPDLTDTKTLLDELSR